MKLGIFLIVYMFKQERYIFGGKKNKENLVRLSMYILKIEEY